jgi:hypothetical protein
MTRALIVIALRGNMFVPRHTVGLASHIRHGNFGEVCGPVTIYANGKMTSPRGEEPY